MKSALKKLALQALNAALQMLLGTLWRTVKQLVEVHELTDLSGAEKRERVFNSLQQEIKTLGVSLSSSLINLGIESAVQLLRKDKP